MLTIVQSTNAPVSKPTTDPPPSPTESVQIVTESGGVITRVITLTPSNTPTSSSAPVELKHDDDGPNVGAIAGGVAGGVIGLFALVGGLVFFLWRRRKQQQEALDAHDGGGSGGITRNTSTMSKAGLLGGASTAGHQYPPRVATNMSSSNSRYGADQDSISPISNRRNSQPLVIDSRLNPNAVMTFAGANLSRESVASLDDSRDYGRQLNVRNPDPHY
jgi:cell wall integrity and stress response component